MPREALRVVVRLRVAAPFLAAALRLAAVVPLFEVVLFVVVAMWWSAPLVCFPG